MNQFEYVVNDGKFEDNTIDAIIIDLHKKDTFSATINAKCLADIDRKLPDGYEMDVISTLSNYFNPFTVEKYEIELVNSQFVYFADFQNEVMYGINDYIEALENEDFDTMEKMDRKYSH